MLSWTFADDVAEAFYLAYQADDPPHRVFNVTGEVRTVGEAVAYTESLVPDVPLHTGTEPPVTLPLATGDRSREELGFVPRFTMEQGISAYFNRLRTSGSMGR